MIVPDRRRSGTNALYLRPPSRIAPRFGRGSLAAHRSAAGAGGRVLAISHLALDVDTPADLATELLFGNSDDAAAAIGSIIEGLTQLRDAVERGDRDYAQSFLQAARSVRSELG